MTTGTKERRRSVETTTAPTGSATLGIASGWTTTAGLILTLLTTTAATAHAQDTGVRSCDGTVRGDLGISGFECSGPECVMRLVQLVTPPPPNSQGATRRDSWLYSTEPTVAGVRDGSPLDGIVRKGDRIVAVDGAPITTRAGSTALHSVEPGERLHIAFRRDGTVRETEVEAVARCSKMVRTVTYDRDGRIVSRGVEPAPPVPPEPAQVVVPSEPAAIAVGRPSAAPAPGVRLGMSFQCEDCVVRTDGDGGVRWSFSRPVEIVRVEEGGPADRAGLRPGDLLRRIDGHPIESREGGEAWGAMEPGEPVRVVVSRPDGSFANVELVPEERPPQRSGVSATAPSPGEAPQPPSPDLETVRYTGVLSDVGVEVRGAPVTVEKDEGAGTITVYTGDNVIVIRTGRGG